MAISSMRSRALRVQDQPSGPVDLPDAVARIATATPGRTVVGYRTGVLAYRDLDAAIKLMMPVIRGQRMDDRSAVVAAIFTGLPQLSDECDPAVVASVVDDALSRISTDITDLLDTTVAPMRAAGTSEIDLRVIASRLAGA